MSFSPGVFRDACFGRDYTPRGRDRQKSQVETMFSLHSLARAAGFRPSPLPRRRRWSVASWSSSRPRLPLICAGLGGVCMFRVSAVAALIGLTVLTLCPAEPAAQTQDESGVVYEAARNKLGLLRYCRDNALIDPEVAASAIAAVEALLVRAPVRDFITRQRGDSAEAAGAAGFWEVSRRRDISAVAVLFRTTPSGLCREWAEETLRQVPPGAPAPARPPVSVTVITPVAPRAASPAPSPEVTEIAIAVPPLPTRAPAEARAGYARRVASTSSPLSVPPSFQPLRPPPAPPPVEATPLPPAAPEKARPIFTRAAAGSYSLSGFSINIFPCLLRRACSDYP